MWKEKNRVWKFKVLLLFYKVGQGYLKEQYPVTAHAPNFDFWTGYREIKRCEERKRTLKKSVCITLGRVWYYTKTSQDYRSMIYCSRWVSIWAKSGFFWRYLYCRWPEDQKMGSAFMPIEGLFLLPASIRAQIIVKRIRRNETATIETVKKKPLRKDVTEEILWN